LLIYFISFSLFLIFFFFFSSRRRHTRCLSDWSSDVCSSDLRLISHSRLIPEFSLTRRRTSSPNASRSAAVASPVLIRKLVCFSRSEERRVGKECRSRWSRYH